MRSFAPEEMDGARSKWSPLRMNLTNILLWRLALSHSRRPNIFEMIIPRVQASARWGQ